MSQAKSHLFVGVSRQVKSRPYISLVLPILVGTRQPGDISGRVPRLSNERTVQVKTKTDSGWVRALLALLGPALYTQTSSQDSPREVIRVAGLWGMGTVLRMRDCGDALTVGKSSACFKPSWTDMASFFSCHY